MGLNCGTFVGPELGSEAAVEMGPYAELLGPNALCAAVRFTSNNDVTAFANTFESCCGSWAFCCATSFSVRISSSPIDSAQVVLDVVGVVCVVVKLTIALPTGVGIVRAEVICVGFMRGSFAIRFIHSALCTVTSCT